MKQQLSVFVKVVELKSFSRAAEDLYMTQPAVSQYIQSLEQVIGMRLLERTNKIISLTRAGEIVYVKGKEILNLYGRMQRLLEDLSNDVNGEISIGASYTYGEYQLPHIIAKMKELYPNITPNITIANTKEILEMVNNYSLDIGIIEGEIRKQREIKIVHFAEDTLNIVAAPDYHLPNDTVSIKDLEKEMWIVREHGSGTREATEKLFQKLNINPALKMEFGSTQVIKESVEAGLGIALLSRSVFQKEEKLKTLKVITPEEFYVKRNFSYAIKNSFQTKAVEVLISLLEEV
ncbi:MULTISPECIES: LysR family transcriptional regulator [Bacillus]|uniref:LysR family transcriptional regulator n=1 Tax=Bacillus TaxID=1386 RepID=UPI0002E25A16|nr:MULTISPECIES: LysR family transcriptional regulator [Bacillus]